MPRKKYKTAEHEVWAGRKPDGWYFYMVNYGTKYQRPKHILRKAEMKHRQRALKGMDKDVRKYISKKAQKYGL